MVVNHGTKFSRVYTVCKNIQKGRLKENIRPDILSRNFRKCFALERLSNSKAYSENVKFLVSSPSTMRRLFFSTEVLMSTGTLTAIHMK